MFRKNDRGIDLFAKLLSAAAGLGGGGGVIDRVSEGPELISGEGKGQ